MNINQNRIVNITAHRSSTDWRDFPKLATITGRVHSGAIEVVNTSIELMLADESFAYSVKNGASRPFESIVETLSSGVTGGIAKLQQAAKTISKGHAASFNPWFKYAKAWTNTEPVTIPLRFDFKMGQYGLWNAKHEVALPIFALLIPALPVSVNALTMQGPFQSATELLALLIKNTLSSEESISQLPLVISNAMLEEVKNNTFRIDIGKQFTLDYAYCTEAAVSFSTATDQYGYPISGSISLAFEGTVPPSLAGTIPSGARFYAGAVSSIPPGGRHTEFAEHT